MHISEDKYLWEFSDKTADEQYAAFEWTPEKIKAMLALYSKAGIRQEELWEIMWTAGLIEEKDYMTNGPCYETLSRAAAKATELKLAASE